MSSYILVVDDDRDIRSMVTMLLRSAHYTVQAVENGAEAVAAIEKERPAAMLLDMQMPVMDGWDVAQRLRERGERVPTVVMTAAHQARLLSESIRAEGYLNKPFDIDELLSVVGRVSAQGQTVGVRP